MFVDMNDHERLFFMGDLHGQFEAFKKAIELIGITDKDAIISTGDLIDRGAGSLESLLYFLDVPNAYAVKGNHEHMFMMGDAVGDNYWKTIHRFNGGEWAQALPASLAKAIAKRVPELPDCLTLEHRGRSFGVVHAQCPEDDWFHMALLRDLDSTYLEKMIWDRDKYLDDRLEGVVDGVDFTFHGHTPGEFIVQRRNQYFIDTGAQDIYVGRGNALTFVEWDGEVLTEHRVTYNVYEKTFDLESYPLEGSEEFL